MKRVPFFYLYLPLMVYCLPQVGPDSGGARLEASVNELHVHTPNKRTAIEWNNFSIDKGEAVRFFQPSKNSAVLNNVVSGEISHLMGTIESKLGRVYIVNPSGIIIGKEAIINVGGLVASTLKITNEDFFQGRDHFFGETKSKVINLGTIEASHGDVNVISYQVSNEGKILAPEGVVSITAANEAWLQPTGNKKVLIRTSIDGAPSEESGVVNTGVIRALQTELDADGNIYKFAINHSGEIEATSLAEENGRLFIRSEHGAIKIAGLVQAPGGHVEVLGERVDVEGPALVDVSHTTQAGEILMGGDWRGESTPFRSDHTYIGPDAFLRADGLESGGGGKVVIWGNASARFFGRLSAEGGALGGDGGLIELSRIPLLASTKISTKAPHGQTGTFLLDPPDITITTAATTTGGVSGVNAGVFEFTGNMTPINVQNTSIHTILDGNNVVIDTSSGTSTAYGSGNITVGVQNASDDPIIDATSSNSLTLTTSKAGTIQFYQSVHLTAPSGETGGDINLNAKAINVGFTDHPTNDIEVLTKGEDGASCGSVNVTLTSNNGTLYIASSTLGKHSYLGCDYAEAEGVGVHITEAWGLTGGKIDVTSGAGESKIYVQGYSNEHANIIDVNFHPMDQPGDLISVTVVAGGGGATASIENNNAIQIDVPGDVSINGASGGLAHMTSSDVVTDTDSTISCRHVVVSSDSANAAYIKRESVENDNRLLITASGYVKLVDNALIRGDHDLTVDHAPSGILLTATATYDPTMSAANALSIEPSSGKTIGSVQLITTGTGTPSIVGDSVDITAGAQISLSSNSLGNNPFITASEGMLNITSSGGELNLLNSNLTAKSALNVTALEITAKSSNFWTLDTASTTIAISTTEGSMGYTSVDGTGGACEIGTFTTGGADPEITLTAKNGITFNNKGTTTANSVVTGTSITATATEGSINLTRTKLDAKSGDITLVAGQNTTFAGGCDLIASYSAVQSVFVVSDQRGPRVGGVGHIETDASTQFTLNSDPSSKLQLFCGFFENNRIDPATNFNGATFTGRLDVPDSYNHYDTAYNPSSLPSAYTAPYGFYYKAGTPYHKIKRGVYVGALEVSSSKISQDSALTELMRQLKTRGTPQMVHSQEQPQSTTAPKTKPTPSKEEPATQSEESSKESESQQEAAAVQEKRPKNLNLL